MGPARGEHILLPPTTETTHVTLPSFKRAGEWECNSPVFLKAETIWILEPQLRAISV